jgi:hypothetical protein
MVVSPLFDRRPCNAVHIDGRDVDGLDFSNSTPYADGRQLAENALLFVGIAAHGCIALGGDIALLLALYARKPPSTHATSKSSSVENSNDLARLRVDDDDLVINQDKLISPPMWLNLHEFRRHRIEVNVVRHPTGLGGAAR